VLEDFQAFPVSFLTVHISALYCIYVASCVC